VAESRFSRMPAAWLPSSEDRCPASELTTRLYVLDSSPTVVAFRVTRLKAGALPTLFAGGPAPGASKLTSSSRRGHARRT